MKTKKSILKRFKITKKRKMLRRPTGQDHFRAKKSGNFAREKHGLRKISKANYKTYKKVLGF